LDQGFGEVLQALREKPLRLTRSDNGPTDFTNDSRQHSRRIRLWEFSNIPSGNLKVRSATPRASEARRHAPYQAKQVVL
jgi:hypothetical protein